MENNSCVSLPPTNVMLSISFPSARKVRRGRLLVLVDMIENLCLSFFEFSDMSRQHNGDWENPKYFKCHVPHQINSGFPTSYQSSREGADFVNPAPPIPAPNLWWPPVPSCSSVQHNQQNKHRGKFRSQVQQTAQPVLTTIVPNSNLAIPVLSSVRRERSTFPNEKKVEEVEWKEVKECNNNIKGEESTEPALLFCSMCVGKTLLGEEALRRHLKIHYEAMFKCGVCRRGFEKLSEAVQHQGRKHADQGNTEVKTLK